MRPYVASLVACLCVLLAQPARGQSGPNEATSAEESRRVQARELFAQGIDLARSSRWNDALASFEQASALWPHASTSYNIGFCERSLGRITRAYTAFRSALAQDEANDSAALTDEERATSTAYLAEAERKLARLKITLEPGLRVTVDGRPLDRLEGEAADGSPVFIAGVREPGEGEPVPRSFVLVVDPGPRVIGLTANDGRQRVIPQTVAVGDDRALEIEMGAAPLAEAPPRGHSELGDEPAEPSLDGRYYAAGAFAVLGVAGVAAAIGLHVSANDLWEQAQAACPNPNACPNDDGFELSNDARRDGNLATLFYGLGAGSLAAAGVLTITAATAGGSDEAVSLRLAPDGAWLVGTF